MTRSRTSCAAILAAVAVAAACPARSADAARSFWQVIGQQLGLLYGGISSLGGGATRGQIWIADVETGEHHAIVGTDGSAWPIFAPDRSAVFALRGQQVVQVTLGDGKIVPIGAEMAWRKLVGTDADGRVLGFVAGRPRAQPAILSRDGTVQLFPQPESAEERERTAVLLQEDRAYADGQQLLVVRSRRGGRGYDVELKGEGSGKTLSDCGDDACGQPSRSADGRHVLYIRDPAH
jgi:hypothetical protein